MVSSVIHRGAFDAGKEAGGDHHIAEGVGSGRVAARPPCQGHPKCGPAVERRVRFARAR